MIFPSDFWFGWLLKVLFNFRDMADFRVELQLFVICMGIENDNGFSLTQQYTLQGVDCYNFGLSFPRNRPFVLVITNLVARNNSII